MKTFVQAMRDCNPVKLMGYLTLDQPPGLFEKHMEVYEKLYAHFLLHGNNMPEMEVALTGLAPRRIGASEVSYDFYGILNPDYKKSIVENLYLVDDIEEVENLWISETLLEQTNEIFVVGEILRNLFSKGERLDISIYANPWDWGKEVRDQYCEQAYLSRSDENIAKRRKWNQTFFNGHLRRLIVNEVQEYFECQCETHDMGNLLYGDSGWYIEYAALNKRFPLEAGRVFVKMRDLKETCAEVGLETYREVVEMKERILIEPSAAPKDKHLVYVKNALGEILELKEVEEERLMCMDIRVLDKEEMGGNKALALFFYHLLYSACAEREHRAALVNRLLKLTIREHRARET